MITDELRTSIVKYGSPACSCVTSLPLIIQEASAALDKKRAAIFRSPPNLALEAA